MTSGILVGGKGRVTFGIMLDQSDEEPAFVALINDPGAGTCKPVTLDIAAARELSQWLARALAMPGAL